MKLFLIALLALVLALPVFSIQKNKAASPAAPANTPLKALPTLNLQDFDGKTVKQEDLGAKVYVVDFWATWCGPCIMEIPHYNRLQEKYGDKGLKIVGVTLASGEATEIKPYVDKFKMKYTVLIGDDNQAGDLRVMGFPTTFIVTKDWKIYKTYIGFRANKGEQIDADIQKLLAEGQ